MFSRCTRSLSLPPYRASQAPRPIFLRALSPTTPEGPASAFACCFLTGIFRLHPTRRTGHLRLANEAESGSLALRLARLPTEFSPVPLLEPTLVWLRCRTGNYMVNSFQFTRSARLILAHRASASGPSFVASYACADGTKRFQAGSACSRARLGPVS